ncbi:class I SAM-dependent methyltransferase [Bradyrhizobium sp. NBAIM14]|uniref:class I SAM-dependent methyltransferase n=1 Tax=Bradyrhizobium sp. NBAIM14 TaxID=2793814 RepID=UPI001CD2A917|nr:class I SAM-dependent methyltransferase [Bradyrhizobium sp. NBAIM14]MCA1501834.1 class I SAM-dependent methyltransferase [Bradyrhizobium sp. NBAIM14]
MLRKVLERLLELPVVYDLNQIVGQPTVRRYTQLLTEEVPLGEGSLVLDLGCGTGATSRLIPGRYVGIDVNPDYIASAKRIGSGGDFIAMDATKLSFPDASFDQVMSIATTHHLDEEQLKSMVLEALRVVRRGGAFHIIDAILPISPRDRAKEMFFRMDRGRFPRKLEHLVATVSLAADVARTRVLRGPMHDVAYLKVVGK